MKYQHSDAMEDFFASDLLRHSSITFSFKRFCGGLALPSVLCLTLLSLPMEESAAAEHRIEMAAEQLEDGVLAYRMVEHQVDKVNITSRYSKQATVPGPTIVLTEGDKVRLTIRNGISMSPNQVSRKIALPQINMNNPHNMWTNRDQSVVYQTQWFDNKLTLINQKTGALIQNIRVGEAPAHVMTRPDNDDITVTNNGEDGISLIPAGTTEVSQMLPTQKSGQQATNPHGHWISADGAQVVTPNIFTNDVGFYDLNSGAILERTPTGENAPGAHPIAIAMMPDSNKYYAPTSCITV